MIQRDHQSLSLSRQCTLLGLSRSALYYTPLGESAATLTLLRRIDELYLQYPFYETGRHRTAAGRLRKPRTSVADPEHRVYPYLLRGLTITDRIRYHLYPGAGRLPVPGGAWTSRRVLAWRLSNTLDTEFCLEALAEALERYEIPDIFNTDQGSQFTSIAFTGLLDGGNTVLDGRSWSFPGQRVYRAAIRSVYLHELADGFVAQRVIDEWIEFYNEVRPHSALGGTPAEAYRGVAAPGQQVA